MFIFVCPSHILGSQLRVVSRGLCPVAVQMPRSKEPQVRQGNGVPFDHSKCVETTKERDLRVAANQSVYGTTHGNIMRFTVHTPENDQSQQPVSNKRYGQDRSCGRANASYEAGNFLGHAKCKVCAINRSQKRR